MNKSYRFLFHNEASRIESLIPKEKIRFYEYNFPALDLVQMFRVCSDLI